MQSPRPFRRRVAIPRWVAQALIVGAVAVLASVVAWTVGSGGEERSGTLLADDGRPQDVTDFAYCVIDHLDSDDAWLNVGYTVTTVLPKALFLFLEDGTQGTATHTPNHIKIVVPGYPDYEATTACTYPENG